MIHVRRVSPSRATTTPDAARRLPPSRSHLSCTVEGTIWRRTSSRADRFEVAQPVRAALTAKANKGRAREREAPAFTVRSYPGPSGLLPDRVRSSRQEDDDHEARQSPRLPRPLRNSPGASRRDAAADASGL